MANILSFSRKEWRLSFFSRDRWWVSFLLPRATEEHKWVRPVKSKPKALRHFKVNPVLEFMRLFLSWLNLCDMPSILSSSMEELRVSNILRGKDGGYHFFCKEGLRVLVLLWIWIWIMTILSSSRKDGEYPYFLQWKEEE